MINAGHVLRVGQLLSDPPDGTDIKLPFFVPNQSQLKTFGQDRALCGSSGDVQVMDRADDQKYIQSGGRRRKKKEQV
jgi:hypothetical protein